MANPNQDARGQKTGRYVRTPEAVARDAEAARLYGQGLSYRQVGEELGFSKWCAIDAVRRATRTVLEGPARDVIALHVSRLEWAYSKAVEIAESDHVVVSHGKIIRDDDGNPLRDHGPVLAALSEARRTLESFRKLAGVDAPSRVSIDAQQLGAEILSLIDQTTGTADGDTST